MTKRSGILATAVLFLASLGLAQAPGDKQPYVIMAPIGNVQLRAGASASVEMDFRVGSEFHINSHRPKADYLIPTVLDRKSTRLNSSHLVISYAVFCLKKK